MKPSNQSPWEDDDLEAMLMDRIEDLFEKLILDMFLRILCRLSEKKQHLPPPLCYRTNCDMRDNIPF